VLSIALGATVTSTAWTALPRELTTGASNLVPMVLATLIALTAPVHTLGGHRLASTM
jgi:hypothetical protein